MSRYRLLPPAQEAVLRDHCGHARYVWNLAVEQHAHWHPGRKDAPGHLEQCRQLTAARAAHPWLAAGSQTVQQQALRDFARAMAAFVDPGNPAGRPSWRKAGRDEGFRITGRRGGSGTCAGCPVKSARSGCPRPAGSGSAGLGPRRPARSPTGSRWTGPGAGMSATTRWRRRDVRKLGGRRAPSSPHGRDLYRKCGKGRGRGVTLGWEQ